MNDVEKKNVVCMEYFVLIVNYKDGKTVEIDCGNNLTSAETIESVLLKSCFSEVKNTLIVSRKKE